EASCAWTPGAMNRTMALDEASAARIPDFGVNMASLPRQSSPPQAIAVQSARDGPGHVAGLRTVANYVSGESLASCSSIVLAAVAAEQQGEAEPLAAVKSLRRILRFDRAQGGVAIGRSGMTEAEQPRMQRIAGGSEERFLGSDVFESSGRNLPPPSGGGTVLEEAREIAVYHRCDVVVIGGGPAGCAAAWAAAQAGAEVTLVERYNCLGGLSTGGLVMWIDRMTDWHGNHVIQGFAREFIERMPREAVAGPDRKSTRLNSS